MKRYHVIGLLIMLSMGLFSCSGQEEAIITDDNSKPLSYDLVISVGKQNGMRMAEDVVQANHSFRGLQHLIVVPFRTEGAVTVNDEPLVSTFTAANKVEGNNYYYFIAHCSLKQGTNRMLVYGQAAPISTKGSFAQNGKLETSVGQIKPADMTFSLLSIRDTKDAHSDAIALANYLTAIANTEGWSSTNDGQLKALYLDFIHADSDDSGLMAGSAANVKAYAQALKAQLPGTDALSTAIKANIDNTTSIAENTYPSSIGLPDGAAVLRWTDDGFSVRTETTTLDNINGITRYTYPAELWYYANSGIYTSNDEITQSNYENKTWSDLLTSYYKGSHFVNEETKSVAIEDPMQYGVGRLQMTLSPITGTLKDSKNNVVNYGDATKLPLTGVIIGGQHTVGFDFKPIMQEQSDLDARFIYDSVVGTAGTDGKWTVNSLVLQSYDNEKVPVLLEFRNDTGAQFFGKDGVVYPGTKFYLIAQLDPADATNKEDANVAAAKGRVFTQDCTTMATMQVKSLANAYSCMPDLLEPRLEIGVQVIMKWVQSTTTIVKL